MDQYVILCDCDPDGQPSDVGYIDDNRASGGRLELRAWPPQENAIRTAPGDAGDRRGSETLTCARCKRSVRLLDSTAAEFVDGMARPLREQWGKTLVPSEEYADDEARSAELLGEIAGDRDPGLASDVPTVTRYAQLYVVPLIEISRWVTKRSKRRD